jgi:hypothetical protein
METITKEQGAEIIDLLKQILAKGGVGGGSGGGFITTKGTDPNFREGVFTGWKAARVTFGFDQGVQLGDIGEKGWDYFMNRWAPRDSTYPADVAFKAAVEAGKDEIRSGHYVPPKYTNKPREPKSERMSSTPPPPPAGGGDAEEQPPF